MLERNLNIHAENLRREAKTLTVPVDVERIAEHRGLRIVGSTSKGQFKLPRGRRGEIRISERLLIVRHEILDDPDREAELLEVISHEVAHDALHADFLSQQPLPFDTLEFNQLDMGRLSFSSSQTDRLEREAIYLGSLLQVPLQELISVLAPAIASYVRESQRGSAHRLSIENAARLYTKCVVDLVQQHFQVTTRTAGFALSYWGATNRPPREWWEESLEVRKPNLL